jgi:hypothetical protein
MFALDCVHTERHNAVVTRRRLEVAPVGKMNLEENADG